MAHTHTVRSGRPINRRDFLKVGGLVGAASVAAACGATATDRAPAATQACPTPAPTQAAQQPTGEIALRIAQISDMHIGPYGPERDGFARALLNIQARAPKIDAILNAGDSIGDALVTPGNKIQAEWDAFTGVVKADCSLPIHHAIGNHDIWGWGLPAAEQAAAKSDPLFGKGWAVRELGLPDRYYTFDQAGWRFLGLDSARGPIRSSGTPDSSTSANSMKTNTAGWSSSSSPRLRRCRCASPGTSRFCLRVSCSMVTPSSTETGWWLERTSIMTRASLWPYSGSMPTSSSA